MDLFLYFTVYAGLSLTGTPSLENMRVKTDECEEKLKAIIQRLRKNLLVQTDVDVAWGIILHILNATLSLYTIYIIYIHIYDIMGYFVCITNTSLCIL